MNVCVKCWAEWKGSPCAECGCTAYWRLAKRQGDTTVLDPPVELAEGGSRHFQPRRQLHELGQGRAAMNEIAEAPKR